MQLSRVALLASVALLATNTATVPAATSVDRGELDASLTARVKQEVLPIQVELAGVFVSENKDEIRMEPKEYRGDLIVTMLREEGESVLEGDVLMEFDESSLTRALEEAQNEGTDAEVELTKAQSDQDAFEIERTSSLRRLAREVALAELALEAARDKALTEQKKKERSIRDAEERLADGEVDYQQLIELYEERELHTATENILIDREKRKVRDMKRSLEDTRNDVAHWEKFEKNKDVDEKELDLAKKQAELSKTEIQYRGDLAEKDAAVAKAQRNLDKATKKVNELEQDSQSLQVVSPRDGVVFYGTTGHDMPAGVIFMGGRNNEMRVGGRVRTHDVLMTIAAMENLAIKMRVLENDIQHMKAGLPISVHPDAFPNLKLSGRLTQVDQVASREGFFSEVREFTVKGSYEGVFPQLRSGMNCRVTVLADSVPDAVQVPVVAVFEDAGDHYCFVKDGQSARKQKVELGATNGTRVQITSGLRPDEVVYLYDPNRI